MFKPFATSIVIGAVALLAESAAAQATAMDGILAAQLAQNQQLDLQMSATQNWIVTQNVNDPSVQAMYAQRGGAASGMSLEQFAYMSAATNRFDPRGVASFNATTADIARRDAAAMAGYHSHVNQLWAETNAYTGSVNDRIARQRGELLSGTSTYYAPQSGMNYTLSNTAPANTWTYDPYAGNAFHMDAFGNYTMQDPNGWQQPMFYQP